MNDRLEHAIAYVEASKEKPDAGFIYLVKCHDFVKIGIANEVRLRLSSLQTGNPYLLKLVAHRRSFNAASEEASLHKRYEQYQVNGEWFRLPKALLKELVESFKS